MQGILGPLVGGLLAITGGLLVAITADHRERNKWKRDARLKASSDLLTALQGVVRRVKDIALAADVDDTGAEARAAHYLDATTAWNSAMYTALIVGSETVVELLFATDREIDNLFLKAQSRQWSPAEFRQERRHIGELAAQLLDAARRATDSPALQLTSVWSWEGF